MNPSSSVFFPQVLPLAQGELTSFGHAAGFCKS
eukprot:SAG31_NODE_48267_length_196_cov_31.886598_1_plen_32_part_10